MNTPTFIWEYGMTPRQHEWLEQATKAQRATFMQSAPLRIACQSAITKEGELVTLYLATIHGVPIAQPALTPEEAVSAGEFELERYRADNDPAIHLDLAALGIAGPDVDEYAHPEDRERLFFAEAMRGFERIRRGENPYGDDSILDA